MAFNRRLIIWLAKAYVKRWGKTILISFLFGLVIFFLLIISASSLTRLIPVTKKDSIGIAGAYKLTSLPAAISDNISRGLTKIVDDGSIKPDLASSWDIQNNGKVYVFHLDPMVRFSNGNALTSDKISYNFSDVTITRPDSHTITFALKDPYAPFLVTASRPVVQKNFTGVGNYKLSNVDLNGDFLKSIRITSIKNSFDTKEYFFYPTLDALKTAFMLGEVRSALGLTNVSYQGTSFANYPNITVHKYTNYRQLVTLFYNNDDQMAGDKRLRDALSYSLPDTFQEGQREFLPYPPTQWFYDKDLTFRQKDIAHAKLLLGASVASLSANLTIKTLPKYNQTAQEVAASWKELGIKTTIQEVDSVPSSFQVYLGDFTVPRDPDQYTLWHSDQENNITDYRSIRIDKLLEDGRKTINQSDRKKIYDDFQKYLLDDSPASFLYFPYEYDVTRK